MRVHAFHRLYQHRLSLSTKPFQARGAKVERCQYCQVAIEHCLCAHQPDVHSQIAVLLLVSENEVFKPSNTGRLIADMIKDTHVYQWNRTDPDKAMLKILRDERYQPVIIFPEEYVEEPARVLAQGEKLVGSDKIPLLIFLDGSWREARRMFRKSPYLDAFPVLSIHPETLSQYQMRSSANDQHLATAEVAALVLKQLGEVAAAQALNLWFAAFRESYLLSKTRLKPDLTKPALAEYLAHY